MSSIFGIKAISPTVAADPHILGVQTPRSGANDLLLDIWNGSSSTARVLAIQKDGAVRAGAGTAGAPAYTFLGDPDSGLYRIDADNVGIAVGGSKIVDVDASGVAVTGTLAASGEVSLADNLAVGGAFAVTGAATFASQITVADGSVEAPALAFSTAPNTGFYRTGQSIVLSIDGSFRWYTKVSGNATAADLISAGTTGGAEYRVATSDLTAVAGFGINDKDHPKAGRFYLHTWNSDYDFALVMDSDGANPIEAIVVDPAGVTTFANQIRTPNGTVGAPAYAFEEAPNTGFYRTGQSIVLSIDGSFRWYAKVSDNATVADLISAGTTGGAEYRVVTSDLTAVAGFGINDKDHPKAGRFYLHTKNSDLGFALIMDSDGPSPIEALVVAPDGAVTLADDLEVRGSVVKLTNLPTSDPGVAGQLWNDGGALKVSAGA